MPPNANQTPKTTPSYRSEVRMVHLPWGGSIEIMSSELGRWAICNLGVIPRTGAESRQEMGDLLLTVGTVAVRAPVLSLLLRPPGGRIPTWGGDAHQAMQAMTSTFPLRGVTAEHGTTVLLQHQVAVARGAFGDETLEHAQQPVGFPSPPPPFLVELAGVLRVDLAGASKAGK